MSQDMYQKLPKLSIVTPSYNQGDFLESTIKSVLSQNYPNLEYIIIDGSSTDGSVEIVKKYEDYLHFWCSEPDAGQYDAINKGFSHATGEIMAWINSDDMYYPWSFQTVVNIMLQFPQIEWLTTLSPGYWDWHGFCTGFSTIPGYSREAFLDGCYIPYDKRAIGYIQQESTFWRRNLWEKADSQIATKFKLAGDFDLWTKFFSNADLYGIQSPLGGFRFQANQRSRQIEEYMAEAQMSLADMREALGWQPNSYKTAAFNLNLHRVPKLRSLVKSVLGYDGQRIVRENANLRDGCWRLEKYRFNY